MTVYLNIDGTTLRHVLLHSIPEVTKRFPYLFLFFFLFFFFFFCYSSLFNSSLLSSSCLDTHSIACCSPSKGQPAPFTAIQWSAPIDTTSSGKFAQKVTNNVKIFIRSFLSLDIQGLPSEQKKNVARTEVICVESMSRKIYSFFYILQQMRRC